MVWNSVSPDGTQSVKANVPIQQQNTTYTEVTMNNDHFWKIGVDEDGHHKAINMENYADTSVGAPVDAPIATGMDGVMYLKTSSGTVQGFYKNAAGIYQFIPAFLTGTVALTSSFSNVVAVPDNTFGQIFIWRDGSRDMSSGSFTANTGAVQAISYLTLFDNNSTPQFAVQYANGTNASGLNIRAKTSAGTSGNYKYRIMYWTT